MGDWSPPLSGEPPTTWFWIFFPSNFQTNSWEPSKNPGKSQEGWLTHVNCSHTAKNMRRATLCIIMEHALQE